jgi:methionine-rich copper-binding protein CopC
MQKVMLSEVEGGLVLRRRKRHQLAEMINITAVVAHRTVKAKYPDDTIVFVTLPRQLALQLDQD